MTLRPPPRRPSSLREVKDQIEVKGGQACSASSPIRPGRCWAFGSRRKANCNEGEHPKRRKSTWLHSQNPLRGPFSTYTFPMRALSLSKGKCLSCAGISRCAMISRMRGQRRPDLKPCLLGGRKIRKDCVEAQGGLVGSADASMLEVTRLGFCFIRFLATFGLGGIEAEASARVIAELAVPLSGVRPTRLE